MVQPGAAEMPNDPALEFLLIFAVLVGLPVFGMLVLIEYTERKRKR